MNLRKKYLKVPVVLCKYALEERIDRTVMVYIYMNLSCSGKLTLDSKAIAETCDTLSLHRKTLNKHLAKLYKKNWIGYNIKSGITHVRGIDKIREMEGFTSKTAAEFRKDDIHLFKEFCIASFAGYLINKQRSNRRCSERYKSRSKQKHHLKVSEYDSIALQVYADFLSISKTTAHNYLQLAEKAGYLEIRPHYKDLNHQRKDASAVMRFNPQVKLIENRLVLQGPNEIDHNIYFRSRKNIEPYKSHPLHKKEGKEINSFLKT